MVRVNEGKEKEERGPKADIVFKKTLF